MAIYSEKVMDHFMNPRNVGEIEDPDGVGEVGNPVCGDMMTFTIKVRDDRIEDVKFKTFGCGAAIAVSSMVSEMAKGKTLDEAMKITNTLVAEELGGLPKNKLHCSNLGADALHEAIKDYRERLKTGEPRKEKEKEDRERIHVKCPYCDQVLEETYPFCGNCKTEFTTCSNCGKLVLKKLDSCPHCKATLEAEEESGGQDTT